MRPEAILEKLWWLDWNGLYFLNVKMANPVLDRFWLGLTHAENISWVRFGLFPAILLWLIYQYKMHAIKPLLALALAVGLTDTLCYRGIKTFVQRPRPTQNEELREWLRPVGVAHGSGFPSNHAANCFAGAVTLSLFFPVGGIFFYALAALVALSRPALGVHYPSDVLAGAILGIIVAWWVRALVLNRFAFFRWPPFVSPVEGNSGGWRTRKRRLSER